MSVLTTHPDANARMQMLKNHLSVSGNQSSKAVPADGTKPTAPGEAGSKSLRQ